MGSSDDLRLPGSDIDTALPKVLRLIGSVVAPATLVTALLIYFGRLHITGFFRYFGVNFTAMDFTTQDYLIRSADGLFVPLTVAAGATLLAVWIHRIVTGVLKPRARQRVIMALLPVVAVAGLGLLVVALVFARDDETDDDFLSRNEEIGGLSLALGVLLLVYAARLARWLPWPVKHLPAATRTPDGITLIEWTAAFVLVSIGLFWAVGSYAIGVGTGRAAQMESQLPGRPDAVVFSQSRLVVDVPGVEEVECVDVEAAYRYRYDNLKLVLQSGGQYFFLPGGWNREDGVALLIPRTDTMRLEFESAWVPRSPTC